MSNVKDFVLLLDTRKGLERRILPAFFNARLRFADGIARTKSMPMEMLLLVCGTMNIGKAIRECGAKDGKKFIAVATSDSVFGRYARKNGVTVIRRIRPAFDAKVAANVAMTELLSE